MADGGALIVSLAFRDGAWRAAVDAPASPSLDALARGRTAEEAARLVGLLAEREPAARQAAARAAFGLTPRSGDPRRIAAEALREHVTAALVLWPRALAMPAETPPAELGVAGETAARALFGGGGLPARLDGLETWMTEACCAPARVMRRLWRRWDGRWGRATLPIWRPADGAAGLDPADATWRGRPFDLSVAARVADVQLMREVEARRGRGVAWRLLARLVDAERLLRGLREEGPLDGPATLAPGVGVAAASAGSVLAFGAVAGGRVTSLALLAPEDAALHPEGVLARMLDHLPHDRGAPVAPLVALAVAAAEVRAPLRIALGAEGAERETEPEARQPARVAAR